jgi:hypothetical protein
MSFELVGQIAAPGFDSEFILHRASTNRLIRMRMEAWVEGETKISVDRPGRLMEARSVHAAFEGKRVLAGHWWRLGTE